MNIEPIRHRGVLLVVSAPSGTGKSAVLAGVMAREPGLAFSVSWTTRAPRPGEVQGQSYNFIAREEFESLIAQGAFYEWAEVHGKLYGTPQAPVEAAINAGRDIALDIDVQGGLNVKKRSPGAVLIYLLPPSSQTLESRLRGRGTESEDSVRTRMENARGELAVWPQYDYVLVNDELEKTIESVRGILAAERLRTHCHRIPAIE